MYTAHQTVALAEAYINSGPSLFYSQYSKFATKINSGNWCCVFVSCILNYAGVKCVGFPNSWCPTACDEGKNSTSNVNIANAKEGDIVFFDFDKPKNGRADHVGILVSKTNLIVTTIDGNVSGKVGLRNRYISDVIGITRPEYKKEDDANMSAIKVLQQYLQSKGYYIGYLIDGDCGYYTVVALQTYLKKLGCYNYDIDGKWGIKTTQGYLKALKDKIF